MVNDEVKAKKYHSLKHKLLVVNLVLTLVLLGGIIWGGFAVYLKNIILGWTENIIFLRGLYIMALSFIFYVISFPLDFYESFILERKFNLSNQSLSAWIKDNLKKILLSLVLSLIVVEFLYLFLEKYASIWWILAALGWFVLTILVAKITPAILLPLFFKYVPLEDIELKNKIKEMFAQALVPLKDIYMINFSAKTKKLNAAVIGFGKSRRVILTDNLLKSLSHDEILSIVAHELGHYKNKDTIKIIVFGFIDCVILFYLSDIILRKSFFFFGYASIADIAGLTLFFLVMFVLGFFNLPLQNGFIRHLERKADLYSLTLVGSSDVFISMMEKLAKSNLADPAPSRFIEIMLYDHPPVGKRIKLAQEYKNK